MTLYRVRKTGVGGWGLILMLLLCSKGLLAQAFSIQGYVREADSHEPVAGGRVEARKGTDIRYSTTNAAGFFSLSGRVSRGDSLLVLRVSAVSFVTREIAFPAEILQQEMTIYLESQTLDQVEIEEYAPTSVSELGKMAIPMHQLKSVPVIAGEIDILKSLTTIPGIAQGVEGSAGIYVRGGSPGQNLILLDGAPVYNVNHLFGFLSIFNADALQSVEAYKGAFPARYGGRLSSVINIQTKEGHQTSRQGKVQLGLLTSSIFWEGPIRDSSRTTFALGGRSSYLGLLALPWYLNYRFGEGRRYFQYWMADGNARMHHRFHSGGQLSLSVYASGDALGTGEREVPEESNRQSLRWGNTTATLRYRQPLGKKWFWSSMLVASNYGFGLARLSRVQVAFDSSVAVAQSIDAGLRDLSWKQEVDWYPFGNQVIRFGSEVSRLRFNGGSVSRQNSLDGVTSVVQSRDLAWATAAFVEWEGRVCSMFSMQAGLRLSSFASDTFFRPMPEPRLALRAQISPSLRVAASASVMRQYIHLVSTSGIGLPNDVFVPSTARLPASRSRSLSAGIFFTPSTSGWEISLEGFYRQLSGLPDFQLGTNFLEEFQRDQSNLMTGGQGRAQGLELLVKKSAGIWTGWMGYTLSRSERSFEQIQMGAWYPADFDRRHDLNLTSVFQATEWLTLSVNFVWQSGRPVSFPVAQVPLPNQQSLNDPRLIFAYSERNNVRLPSYHRLDIACHISSANHPNRSWSWGIYNLYNRQNAFFFRIAPIPQSAPTAPPAPRINGVVQTSFIPFLPYVSYSWKL